MCDCRNVEIGSYDNQVLLRRMPHMYARTEGTTRDQINVDRCLADEILKLWRAGIRTTGCCCGHNQLDGFIGVVDDDVPVMERLGYERRPNETDASRRDGFYPKSVARIKCATFSRSGISQEDQNKIQAVFDSWENEDNKPPNPTGEE